MAPLKVSLLGKMEFQYPESEHTPFRRSLRLALLAYLIQQKRAFSRKYLSELVWPSIDSEQSRTYLRNILQRLRSDFGPYLIVEKEMIGFDVSKNVWIDSQIFEESVYRFNLQQLAGEDLKEPADQLSEALTLYKGKFLANYSRSDSVAFEKWLVSERQRLHSTAINSYHTLLSLRIEHREYEKGILDARRLLSLEPFDEMGHLCMMQFFVMNNELRKAQSTFERYETLLERDLGIAGLGDEIVSLYKQIGRKLHARSNKGDLLFPPSFESVDSSAELIKSRFTSSRGGHEQPDSYIEKSFLLQDLLIRKDQSIVTLISPIEGSLIPFFKMLENRFSSQLTDGIHLVSTKELDQKIVQNRLYDIQSSYYPIRNALLTQICHLLFPHENAKLSPNDMLEQIRAADALLIFPNYTSHKFVDQVIAELVAGQPSIKVIVGSAKKLQIDQEIVMDMDGSDPSRPALG